MTRYHPDELNWSELARYSSRRLKHGKKHTQNIVDNPDQFPKADFAYCERWAQEAGSILAERRKGIWPTRIFNIIIFGSFLFLLVGCNEQTSVKPDLMPSAKQRLHDEQCLALGGICLDNLEIN